MFIIAFVVMQSVTSAVGPNRLQAVPQQRLTENICRDCELSVRLRVTLGRNGLENQFSGEPSSVSTDRAGRYYVTDFQNRHQIHVFDAQGNAIESLGRRGQGPNEFEYLTCAAVRGDSLFAVDLNRGSIVVIDLVTSREGRRIPFRWPATQLFSVNDSTFATVAAIRTADRIAFTFHEITRAGLGRSSGELSVVLPGNSVPNLRTGSLATDGNVWLAHRAAYQIEKWSLANRQLRSLVREVDWFRPYTRTVRRSPTNPPHPQIVVVKEIERDLLAVIINRPSPRWQQELGKPVIRDGRETYDYLNSKLYESVVEIIDLAAGTVIYRETSPRYLIGFIEGTSDFYAWRTVDGVPFIDVLTLSFSRPGIEHLRNCPNPRTNRIVSQAGYFTSPRCTSAKSPVSDRSAELRLSLGDWSL